MKIMAKPGLARLAVPACAVLGLLFVAAYTFAVYPWRLAHGDPKIPADVSSALKALIALSALGLSLHGAFRRLSDRPVPRRVTLSALAVFGALGVLGYLNFGDVGYVRGYHRWELFHYYLGAKYHHALGYTNLYAAAVVAQAELGPDMAAEVRARSLRDLETDTVVPATTALERADVLKARFFAGRMDGLQERRSLVP